MNAAVLALGVGVGIFVMFLGFARNAARSASTADIVAQRALRCLILPTAAFESFLEAHPKVMYRLLQGEARKVRNTTRWLS